MDLDELLNNINHDISRQINEMVYGKTDETSEEATLADESLPSWCMRIRPIWSERSCPALRPLFGIAAQQCPKKQCEFAIDVETQT